MENRTMAAEDCGRKREKRRQEAAANGERGKP